MTKVYVNETAPVMLGKAGENEAREIIFDIGRLRDEYGNGTCSLLHKRFGEDAAYPCTVTQSGDCLIWVITNADVAIPGLGQCELSYCVDDTVAKSIIFTTYVETNY